MSDETGAGTGEEGFVGRWSRRKLAAREQRGPDDADPDTREEAVEAASADGVPDQGAGEAVAPVLTDADMPDIDSLAEDASYADFLSPGVSDALRQRALRKLFHSPAFNVRDGLNDYDDDFTKFEKLGDIITADMKHRMEMEAERMRREAVESLHDDPGDSVSEESADDRPDEVDAAPRERPRGEGDGDPAAIPDEDNEESRKPADDQ